MTGLFLGVPLPGYDLAVLYTVGATASPALAVAITARVTAQGIGRAYLVNLALVVCREIRIHAALPDSTLRADRLSNVDRLHRKMRSQLREQADA